jgi:hypothetical protein
VTNPPSRIEEARRRALGPSTPPALGAAGFLAVLLLVRASHPGHAQASTPASSGSSSSSSTSQSSDDGLELGSGSIAPSSGSTPQAQTTVS